MIINKIMLKKNIRKFSMSLSQKLRFIRYKYIKNRNLTNIAISNGCDKWGAHFYTPHYERHFKSLRNEKIILLEIGIGGYSNINYGGASLRMWKEFFKKGEIYGIDIYDKSKLNEKRIKTFQGSQVDNYFLEKVLKTSGCPDIIIDDGSHINEHIIESFKLLFPKLKNGGIYVVEDIQTSYWPDYGGDSKNLDNPDTAINFFKSLVHSLNYQEMLIEEYQPTYYDQNIISIQFYHNLIFIYKGSNDEPSNMVKNNRILNK